MMRILVLDNIGNMLHFSWRCGKYGHEVRHWRMPQNGTDLYLSGNGFEEFKIVKEWESSIQWADLIIVPDNSHWMASIEARRKRGFPIFGPCMEVVEWETKREIGQKVLYESGLPCLPSTSFKKIREAQAFLIAHPGRYVCKPNGDKSKDLSYVSKGPADMMTMLERWATKKDLNKDGFIFQPFFKGTEFGVGGWMGKDGFLRECGWLESFEHKKFMNGEIGINTGEMGTVIKYVKKSKLAEIMLEPLEGRLIRAGYVGYIDIAVIIGSGGKICPLEFTSRLGWPLFPIQTALHKGDPAQWMWDALRGNDTLQVKDDVATGVVMVMPDFPYCELKLKDVRGFPITGWETLGERGLWMPEDVEMAPHWDFEDGKLKVRRGMISSGQFVGTTVGLGESVVKANETAYRNLSRIEVPNSPMYRTDIGEKVEGALSKLQEYGFAEEWRWS